MIAKFQSVEIRESYPFGYARGAKPGFECNVTLSTGEMSYDKLKITLTPEATREVVTLAVAKAMEQLTIDPATINVEGAPGVPEREPPEELSDEAAPMFTGVPTDAEPF